jgi:hypothetical protein
MDGAFTNLDDLSDREISERLESLFDSSLPSLDSPILQDHAATAAANILEGTPTNPEDNQILGQLDNATDGEDFVLAIMLKLLLLRQVSTCQQPHLRSKQLPVQQRWQYHHHLSPILHPLHP